MVNGGSFSHHTVRSPYLEVGETFKSGDLNELGRVLEEFINNFDDNAENYFQGLKLASEEFSPINFAKRLENIINSKI